MQGQFYDPDIQPCQEVFRMGEMRKRQTAIQNFGSMEVHSDYSPAIIFLLVIFQNEIRSITYSLAEL